ncbi:class I glutamine amidotransferase-like protein [Aspergillus sclerotioniger CBS 115572]|uniref:Class I glutamine amidotransferase-like protein n=1 Tax=Aspergillus sclerotioniger CBS 115572 TaxID=1450535 RepID=A0A317XEL0_9EURO|nr:class I glutamine amidotransferase-like protein [Aspergillus sclerotioniger CBS 115572]PWY96232.1 class I glutamine amidotransferase-like protein [Aspergillus sclerotioniger CBS 115572]
MADQPSSTPLRIGIILFPGFQALDAFGPLDCLNDLSRTHNLTLSILSSTLSPVSTKVPLLPNTISQSILPTHTFATAPDLDVLLIPGGLGIRDSGPAIQDAISYIRAVYPKLQYLITVCNGSALAAIAGVLDGRRATTNKKIFDEVAALGPKVDWVPQARWVVDGNIWTSSGVSAGIDVILAWIEEVFGEKVADDLTNGLEYTRHRDANIDPFAKVHGL